MEWIYRVSSRFVVAAALLMSLSGCFVASTIKSELSSYAEPSGSDLAHIRLIGSRNVKVYPNSTCARLDVPGGGYPAGPQWGGQRKRDLGMPKLPDTPKHYVEIAARPDEPIAATFAFSAESYRPPIAGVPGMRGTKTSTHCNVTGSFVPEASGNYEARAMWNWGACAVMVTRLVDMDGNLLRLPVARLTETACGPAASDDSAALDTVSGI